MSLSANAELDPEQFLASMGEVWKPRLNRDTGTSVSAQQSRERFARKASAIGALDHSNIGILPGAAGCRFLQRSGSR
jgi:hypothetical protein